MRIINLILLSFCFSSCLNFGYVETITVKDDEIIIYKYYKRKNYLVTEELGRFNACRKIVYGAKGGRPYGIFEVYENCILVEKSFITGQFYRNVFDSISGDTVVEMQDDGTFKFYHENGKLANKSKYVNGKLHGVDKSFSEEGKLIEKKIWKNGELKREKKFNKRKK